VSNRLNHYPSLHSSSSTHIASTSPLLHSHSTPLRIHFLLPSLCSAFRSFFGSHLKIKIVSDDDLMRA
jgi:hypothetical protein